MMLTFGSLRRHHGGPNVSLSYPSDFPLRTKRHPRAKVVVVVVVLLETWHVLMGEILAWRRKT
jgi:hypothetical protein